MATLQPRGKRWRAIVRRKGHAAQTKTFPIKTAAKTHFEAAAWRSEIPMADIIDSPS
ncbi:hypothetical protein [uncultured Xanthomonas sp.]|uniref:hypothetical protein n=1 Tax=uncultured Xanthomonas sp. TaxID=152831 RepID=UPI0025E9BB4A|nr:hypothetical protein [uncultured Xanthomonas sp.]